MNLLDQGPSKRMQIFGGALLATATGQPQTIDRTTLPIAEPKIPHCTVLDVRNATAPPYITGKVEKVTVELKEMPTDEKAEAAKGNAGASYKKAVSD